MGYPAAYEMSESFHKYRCLLVCVFLAAVTFAVYWPVLKHDFVKYDDDKYITDNRRVRQGLSWESVAWAFTEAHFCMWHPVTTLSQMLDCELYGLSPGPHHLTSLLIHVANVVLLFLVFKRMTGTVWASAFVAAVFALHPLQLESVAWLAERKNVLSGFFLDSDHSGICLVCGAAGNAEISTGGSGFWPVHYDQADGGDPAVYSASPGLLAFGSAAMGTAKKS